MFSAAEIDVAEGKNMEITDLTGYNINADNDKIVHIILRG